MPSDHCAQANIDISKNYFEFLQVRNCDAVMNAAMQNIPNTTFTKSNLGLWFFVFIGWNSTNMLI